VYTCRLKGAYLYFLRAPDISLSIAAFDQNSRIVGGSGCLARQGRPRDPREVALEQVGEQLRIGVVWKFRAFFSRLRVYCSSPMVGTEAYRVAFERGNREGGACSLRDGTIG